jgi:hypothetical protein
MSMTRVIAVVVGIAAAGAAAAITLRGGSPASAVEGTVWTEIAWPFALDQWGGGRAFRCDAVDCGGATDLYLRAKIGFCNCSAAIDDEEVDRVADFDLTGGKPAALGPGRPIDVIGMNGRSRLYALAGSGVDGRSVLAIALHDRCDMIVATIVAAGGEAAVHEKAALELFNRAEVRRWVEATLGL